MSNIKPRKPKYEYLADMLEQQIKSGKLKSGDALPPIRTLTRNTGMSISTVACGLELLEKRGLAERFPRRGYFVKGTPNQRTSIKTISFITLAISGDAEHYVKGIHSTIDHEKYIFSVHCTHADIEKYQLLINRMPEYHPDGVILMSVPKEFSFVSAGALNETDIPVVIIGTEIEDISCDRVVHTGADSGKLIGQYIRENNYRDIAFILSKPINRTTDIVSQLRIELAESDIELPDDKLITFESSHGWGKSPDPYIDAYVQMKELLRNGFRSQLIICSHDYPAVGVLRAILEAGIKVPQEMQVISALKCAVEGATPMKLTTVDSHRDAQGRIAANLLKRRIEGYTGPYEVHYVAGHLIEGQTTRRIVEW